MATSIASNLPQRPGFGVKGKPAKVSVNSYPVVRFPNATIKQYDVTIGNGDEKRGLIKKVWFSQALQAQFGSARSTVLFDGNKIAWSALDFPFGDSLTTSINLDEPGARPRKVPRDNSHRVVIKKAPKAVPLHVLEAYIRNTYAFDNDVLICINFLDHLMRETPSKNFIAIRRSFFQKQGCMPLERGVEAWKGIFQSVRATQGGRLTINVDVATTVFWSQGTVLEIITRMLRINQPEDLINRFKKEGLKGATMREVNRIKKVNFVCKHRKRDTDANVPKRTYTIEGFAESAKDYVFEMRRTKDSGEVITSQVSIYDYFIRTYNIRLKYPDLPLIKSKKKGEVFPMELAFVAEGQRYPYKLDERQTAEMIKFTVQRPGIRATNIKENVTKLDWVKDPILRQYGMEIDTNMIRTNARIMPAPKICYGAGSQDGSFVPRDGRWDLRGKKFVKPGAPLKAWGIMIFGNPRFCDETSVKNFVRTFITTYAQHGGVVDLKNPPILYADSNKAVGNNVYEIYKKVGNVTKLKPQILFFILQLKAPWPYNEIKSYCDTFVGVTSQCLQSKHISQAKPQYCSNVSMKVNAKLGGATCYLDNKDHPLHGKEPTVIIGADVSHAAPGVVKASFASMVGSIDLMGARFAAICNTNGERVEVITTKNIRSFIVTLLRAYKVSTGKIPQRMFYFRDGVSEGQYSQIIDRELNDIREACKILQADYAPKITVTICSKRHHMRCFPVDRHASDKNGNCVPGTIVERDVTHPTEYDFYLTAHSAIQGTARPVHYHVIHDENKMPVDAFQSLVYNTSYTYMRATCSVSLIPAVYYAHLASARARAHEATIDEHQTMPTSGTPVIDVSVDVKPLSESLRHQMWFI